eukprot:GHVS01000414.1.p1 GENE.GHVS01000414.1~~GHVS01000414.1.p1  ORF type:complete len:353 (+),score=33.23 GHVS01000414.1:148-1206(+)
MPNDHVLSLFQVASQARSRSYCPHSHQWCGAAVLVTNHNAPTAYANGHSSHNGNSIYFGGVTAYPGCTVDSAAYPQSMCSVQAAVLNALSDGVSPQDVSAIALCSKDIPAEPIKTAEVPMNEASSVSEVCGKCRQVVAELGSHVEFYLLASHPQLREDGLIYYVKTSINHLLPMVTYGPPPYPDTSPSPSCVIRSLQESSELFPGHSVKPSSHALAPSVIRTLCEAAVSVCSSAYVPYFNFPVGAALLASNSVISGCNIMNRSFGSSICAERCCIAKAVSQGRISSSSKIAALAVVCLKGTGSFSRPCGGCRQFLVEFGDYPVICMMPGKIEGAFSYQVCTCKDLLPASFSL